MARPARRLDELLAGPRLRRGATGLRTEAPAQWSRQELAGRLTELSGSGASACLTAALGLVIDAQRQGETVAWITSRATSFFPPDAAAGGVDLDTLPVVRVPRVEDVARAADRLVRSGAFGLVVMDLGARALVPAPLVARLVGLAERHDTALVALTEKPPQAASLGSLVTLRAVARRQPTVDGRFVVEVNALKDKRRAPGWTHTETCHGPAGLR